MRKTTPIIFVTLIMVGACSQQSGNDSQRREDVAKIYAIESSLPAGFKATRDPVKAMTAEDVETVHEANAGTHASPTQCETLTQVTPMPQGTLTAGLRAENPAEHVQLTFSIGDSDKPLTSVAAPPPGCEVIAFSKVAQSAGEPSVSGTAMTIAAPHVDGVDTYGVRSMVALNFDGSEGYVYRFTYAAKLSEHRILLATLVLLQDGRAKTTAPQDAADLFVKAVQLVRN